MHYLSQFIFHFLFKISSSQDIIIFHVMNTHAQLEQTFTLEDLQSIATPTEKKKSKKNTELLSIHYTPAFLKVCRISKPTLYVGWLLKKMKWLFNQSMRGRTHQPTEPTAIQSPTSINVHYTKRHTRVFTMNLRAVLPGQPVESTPVLCIYVARISFQAL